MLRRFSAGMVLGVIWLLAAGSVMAQTPRPTPTNVPPSGEGGGEQESDNEKRGSISGFIYEDVNWDGRCVNTGVAGEEPVMGIDVQFVSSDRETVITHYSGANGDFGLYPAGQSYWEITVMPEAGWTVTTESTVYVPVYPESLNHENVNFCVARGTNAIINLVGSGQGVALLPESGASAAQRTQASLAFWAAMTAVFGFGFIGVGVYLEHRRRSQA